ncbi:U32 family peptidase [uncultured Clostridium sp.]|uniref:U32 family peptidase n=1 Tax=uncultured Clostridium sp. TaxID=59620 RepID=UPI003458A3EC
MMKKKVEILAPAGSFESMKAAVAAGADAVYIGGSRFGARAYADNPDEDRMLEAIDYVHLHGCRLYMTVNTLVKEKELDGLYEYLEPYYRQGLDAVIVQDMGVFSYIREHFPDLPVHASTQMTITGPLGAELMMKLGADRIVTARELSLREIKEIYDKTGAEIESFVHGALCYCYSGQCLFSSLIGGRSGNRGRCAQTCRLPFDVKQEGKTLNSKDERYVLSLKDLCTLDILPDLIEAGVYSMKIEGRMKSPRYTAGVVSIYRKYADLYLEKGREGYRVDAADRKKLLDLFDRGGQTEGYYRQHNGRDMVVMKEKPAFREENRELYQYLDQTYVEAVVREPVGGAAVVREGEPLSLTLTCNRKMREARESESVSVTVSGGVVEPAKNQPATEERIAKQIGKTGNTPFYFNDLKVETAGNPFVPIQELNELRRQAFTELEEKILAPFRRVSVGNVSVGSVSSGSVSGGRVSVGSAACERPSNENGTGGENMPYRLTVSLEEPESFETVLQEKSVDCIYLDSAGFDAASWKNMAGLCHRAGKRCYLTLPHIFREEAFRFFEENRDSFNGAGFDGVVVRAWEEIGLIRGWAEEFPALKELTILMDYGIYTMNREAEKMTARMASGFRFHFTLPVELNSRELEEKGCRGGELIVYGRLPMMVTAQCMKKTVAACTKKPELLSLKDRMGKDFPVKNHCRFCYNTIYNSSPLSLLKDRKIIDRLGPESLRLNFTTESREEIRTVIGAFSGCFLEGRETELQGDFTRGHFKRGIE